MSNRKIIRTYSAGVFFGKLERNFMDFIFTGGKRGRVKNARRIWYWEGAASLSQLAVDGTSKPNDCRFPESVSEIELTEIIEVLSVTEKAAKSIDAVPVWKK